MGTIQNRRNVAMVKIEKVDEVHIRIHADPSIKMELSEYFEFYAEGYKFMPAYKNRMWDGKVRLFNAMSGIVYAGLTRYVEKFCETRQYAYTHVNEVYEAQKVNTDAGYQLAKEFDSAFPPRDYQNNAIVRGIAYNRGLFLSPTASGKSYIIYTLARYHVEHGRKVLIIVPTTSLVSQMSTDFVEYNKNRPLDIHKIMGGVDKNIEADYTVTTWQSIYKLPKQWYEKFDVVMGDEAHLFKAKSLTKILEKTPHIKYRYGFTGTLDDSQTHKLVLEGLFGKCFKVTDTKKLIDDNTLAEFDIKALVLQYANETRQLNKNKNYQEEIDWIVRSEARNKFIRNLAWSLEGNTLILFQFVEKHGQVLEPLLQKDGKTVHFIHGGVDADVRESVRKTVDRPDEEKIVLWFGENEVELSLEENVTLSDNSHKKACELTTDDDISEKWLKTYIKASKNA